MSVAEGKRVLVVEDEALIAAMIVEWLEEMGCLVLGPAAQVSYGSVLAQTKKPDAAVLDVNVSSEPVYPLADYLRERHIPVVFATGYGESAAAIAYNAPVIEKPFTRDQLADALALALGAVSA